MPSPLQVVGFKKIGQCPEANPRLSGKREFKNKGLKVSELAWLGGSKTVEQVDPDLFKWPVPRGRLK